MGVLSQRHVRRRSQQSTRAAQGSDQGLTALWLWSGPELASQQARVAEPNTHQCGPWPRGQEHPRGAGTCASTNFKSVRRSPANCSFTDPGATPHFQSPTLELRRTRGVSVEPDRPSHGHGRGIESLTAPQSQGRAQSGGGHAARPRGSPLLCLHSQNELTCFVFLSADSSLSSWGRASTETPGWGVRSELRKPACRVSGQGW